MSYLYIPFNDMACKSLIFNDFQECLAVTKKQTFSKAALIQYICKLSPYKSRCYQEGYSLTTNRINTKGVFLLNGVTKGSTYTAQLKSTSSFTFSPSSVHSTACIGRWINFGCKRRTLASSIQAVSP